MRPHCELCQKKLPHTSSEAYICSYECTFCKDCVETKLHRRCPNCSGDFQKRPNRNP
ncbi:MAG: DUF1272 domain-containing protein [Flavobacteriaceae bacterium]